jgi:hypothetical protein
MRLLSVSTEALLDVYGRLANHEWQKCINRHSSNCPATLERQGRGLESSSCNASILLDLIPFAPDLLSAKYLV